MSVMDVWDTLTREDQYRIIQELSRECVQMVRARAQNDVESRPSYNAMKRGNENE